MPSGFYKRIIKRGGWKLSQKVKDKMSKSRMGHLGYNKGKKMGPRSEETKRKISLAHKGRIHTLESRKNMSVAHLGQKSYFKGKKRLNIQGEKHGAWKGGITPINNKIRGSLEGKLWQDSVKNRDGNTCWKCGENRISKLTVHHILNFSSHPELRFAIDNGITLCKPCHKLFHKIYGYKNNSREQLIEFLNQK